MTAEETLPILFLSSLIDFARVTNVIVVCPDGDAAAATDQGLDSLTRLPSRIGDGVSVTFAETSGDAADLLLPTGSLVLNDGSFHRRVSRMEDWFKEDVFWISRRLDGEDPPEALRLDSNFFYAALQGANTSSFDVRELYRIKSRLFDNFLGSWDESAGLEITDRVVYERRKNMQGVVLEATTRMWDFYISEKDGGGYQGLVPDIMEKIQDVCNFSVEWSIPADNKFGTLMEDGTWNGMIGEVDRKNVDLAAGPLAITLERSAVADYAFAFYEDFSTLLILDPSYAGGQNTVNLSAYLHVFTPKGWILIALVTLLIFAARMVIYVVQREGLLSTGINSSLSFAFKSVLKLDHTFRSTTPARKVFYLTAAMFSIVAMSYYEGMITSFMTAQQQSGKIESFYDTLELDYQVVVVPGMKQVTDLETAPEGSGRRVVYEKTIKNNPDAYYPSFEAVKELLLTTPRTAWYSSAVAFKDDQRILKLTGMVDAYVARAGFAFQMNSEFLSMFNYQMIRMYQSGVHKFLLKKSSGFRIPDDTCGCPSIGSVSALGYDNLLFPTLILSSGMIMACLLMVSEVLRKFLEKLIRRIY